MFQPRMGFNIIFCVLFLFWGNVFSLRAQTPLATAPASPSPSPGGLADDRPNAPGPDYSAAVSSLDAYLRDQVGKDNVKGFSLALVEDGKLLWSQGYGEADPTTHRPATADTLYRLGAVSEIFTSVEALRMVQKGLVGLDEPLAQAVPGFTIHSRFKKTKPTTLRSLLAQHSGLPGFFYRGMWAEPSESLADLTADLRDDYLVAAPQTLYRYSYLDFDLLGRMIELKRGEAFADAVQADLLDPLGMTSSSFENDPAMEMRLAPGCRGGNRLEIPHYRDVPAVGMISTANDVAKFLQWVLGGAAPAPAPLSRENLKRMFEPQFQGLPLDFGQRFGLGWRLSGLEVAPGETTAWRGGEYPGYTSQMAVLPKERLGVVFLSNCNEADKLAGEAVRRALKLMLGAKTGAPVTLEKTKPVMPPVVPLAAEELDRVSGDYSALGQLVRIERQDNHLSAEFSHYRVDLLPVAGGFYVPHLVFLLLFPIDLPQYPLSFSNTANQSVALLGGLPFVLPLQKITPQPIPDAWKAREGDYAQENPEPMLSFQRIQLTEREGFLTVDMKVSLPAFNLKEQEYRVALLPLSEKEATVPGLFYGDGGTLRAEDGREGTRVFYSGYWFKKIPTAGGGR
ncbi:MAG TPA: serine hydrolase domain-containing protein [bacterium]|nr:serine hydrolase domain-containing protein [bacterium]